MRKGNNTLNFGFSLINNPMDNGHNSEQHQNSNANNDQNNLAPLPKHIPFPEVPSTSDLLNELMVFLFVIFSASMQFLHIYRTVWWLPDSYINHTINTYLIDPYLVIFIFIILSRRLAYGILDKAIEFIYNKNELKIAKIIIKYGYTATLMLILGSCMMNIYAKQNYLSFFLLLYPLVVYSLIFGIQIDPFLRTSCEIEGSYMSGMPVHCCYSNATTIRDEIEILKNDFNNRFKQIIFTSLLNAYYAGFVPCFFAQNFLYYDVSWATQHTIFVWLGGFTMCTVNSFPAKYSDILHRASLHLGRWARIDGRSNTNLPPSTWTKSIVWVQGSVVRYSGDFYKSMGPVTTAIPGNLSHCRFFKLFNNPSIIYMLLTGLQTFFVILQILILCFAVEWHNILSLSFLTFTNHHTLFKIVRDYLVTQKVYAAESSIYDKFSAHYD